MDGVIQKTHKNQCDFRMFEPSIFEFSEKPDVILRFVGVTAMELFKKYIKPNVLFDIVEPSLFEFNEKLCLIL